MPFDPITTILDLGDKLIDRLWPDPAQASAAKLELLRMQQGGELAALAAVTDLGKAQAAIDQAEAANQSLFVSGWRPAIGWVCASALAYQYVLAPVVTWLVAMTTGEAVAHAPSLDDGLWQLVTGMLGLGALRTFEKVQGIAQSR